MACTCIQIKTRRGWIGDHRLTCQFPPEKSLEHRVKCPHCYGLFSKACCKTCDGQGYISVDFYRLNQALPAEMQP